MGAVISQKRSRNAMYEAHFGLISRTFGTKAEGPAVFVGPRQADLISGIHQGLAARDGVVTISGPVGVGKTTVVNRALETIHPGRMAAWVGRMAISSEEVLELLLAGFGFKRKTNSTLQRFAAFRRLMHERAAAGIPVAIVIEDARKLGAAALAEVEALTAADTADGGGANIILMGEPGLDDLLADPDLARLKQRIRRRQCVEPLSAAEVQGYLRHAIRIAGADYDELFGAGVADIVTACSEGIPRIINTLCETALNAATEAGDKTISAEFMRRVAIDAFGFEDDLPVTDLANGLTEDDNSAVTGSIPVSTPASSAVTVAGESEIVRESPVADVADVAAVPIPETARHIVVESGRYPVEPDDEPGEESTYQSRPQSPDDTAAYEPEVLIVGDDEPTLTDIPEFINDTQPDLDVLPGSESGDESIHNAEEAFDLDAVLSPEVEATNMMPGVTADLDTIVSAAASTNRMPEMTGNLDEIVAQIDGSQPAISEAPGFDPDDLPTLSDSMRVDFAKQAGDAEPEVDSGTFVAGCETVCRRIVCRSGNIRRYAGRRDRCAHCRG